MLLFHGFPSASHMFRDLMPMLEDKFHCIAPDYPGFGNTDSPSREEFAYTFDHLAEYWKVMTAKAKQLGIGLVPLERQIFQYSLGTR